MFLVAILVTGGASAQAGLVADPSKEHYTDLRARGEYEAALEALDEEIFGLGETVPSKLSHARSHLLFSIGRVDEAIEQLKEIAERRPQPSYYIELAEMYKYRGAPLLYDQWLQQAVRLTQRRSSRWAWPRRNQNFIAIGRIAELMGTNPKTILSAHYDQNLEYFSDPANVYVSAGDLAYRNEGFSIAEGYYLKALEKEPGYQDAMAGLIECYWKSYDERLEGVMAQLLEINPNHPRAHAVVVERMLDVGKTEEARVIIDAQLEINPVSHRFRSLKAALLFLEDDLEGMEALIEEVLDFNPVRSEVYRTIGRFASRHYRFKEGTEFQELALILDPKDYEAQALYTLDLMRLGYEDEGRQELERAFQADPFNVQLYNLLQLMDTLETFETVERGPFVLRVPTHEAPIMAEAALDLLDEVITEMEAKYAIDLEKPVLIEMFDNHDDFMVRSVGLPGNAGHLGICFGKLVTMDTPSVREKGSSNWRSVLWHEFVHVVTLQKTNNRMPRWLSEGISVFEEQEHSVAWSNRLDPNFMQILANEGLPEMSTIDSFFTSPKSGGHLMYGYFIAGDFVQFYVDQYGHEALVDALAAIGKGSKAEQTLMESAETTEEDFGEIYRAHLEGRFKPFQNLPEVAKQEAPHGDVPPVTTLPGVAPRPQRSPFTDALLEAKKAQEEEDWDTTEAALKQAYDLFPDYRGGDAPLRQLALLYKQLGRDEAFRETLERVVISTPQELDASLALIDILRDEADWEAVANQTDWALGIDPYDPSLYRSLVAALVNSDRETEALDALGVLTFLDDGKAAEYRLQRARILKDLKDWEPAKREALLLLEEMPQYWDAQEVLLAIVEESTREEMLDLEDAEPAISEGATP